MKKIMILLSALATIACLNLQAQNITVSGDIIENTTWAADTVFVDDTVRIVDDVTLTVNPGTKVFFNDFYPILVEGCIISEGTETDTIVYSVLDTTGYSTFSHTGWDGFLFDNNTGSMSNNDTSLFSYCTFSYAKELDEYYGGAALRFESYNGADVKNCYFHHNYGIDYGGAVNLQDESVVNFTDCIFTYNYAESAGGAINIGCYDIEDVFDQAVISNCEFSNNRSNYDGSYYGGGALKISAYANTLVKNCVFTENYSQSQGGAIIVSGYASPYIVNNIFAGNTAVHNGGAIAVKYYGSPYIINNTILMNTSQNYGGAMSVGCDNDSILFVNNIVRDNFAIDTSQFYIDSEDDMMVFMNNNISGGLDDYTSIISSGNIDADPMFVNLMIGDIRLKCGSPSQNTGKDTTDYMPETDFIGLNHFVDNIDMGALETQIPATPDLGADQAICEGESLSLDAGLQPDVSYLWSTTEETQSIEVDTEGEYSVILTNSYECEAYDTIYITVNELPVVDLGTDFTMLDNETQTLDAGADQTAYLWNTDETTQTIDIDGSTTGLGEFTYWVEVENEFGCVGTDTIVITVEQFESIEGNTSSYSIYPNPGNGKINIEAQGAEVNIFDLSGRIVYHAVMNENTVAVDLSKENSGMYLMQISKDGKTSNCRLIIE